MVNIVEVVVNGINHTGKAFLEVEGQGKSLAGALGKVGLIGGAALIGIGAKSVQMASDFQSSVVRLTTSAGESTRNIDLISNGMLDMAGKVGISAQELAKGMYTVESAGYHGRDALTVLKAAAQGAKDENADLGKVANAVTDILVDYHLKASDAANMTSKMVAAVSFGKTNFDQFSGSMANVLPLAAAVGLKFDDVAGVLATMTAHGMSANRASQNIANAIRSLEKPSGTMVQEFKLLGISSEQVTQKLGQVGLAGTMQWLSGVAKDGAGKVGQTYVGALGKLMGTAPGLTAALMTTGENAKATNEAIAGIGKASADAQGNVEGFAAIQKTFAQRLAEMEARLSSLAIRIGNVLMPVLSAVFGFIDQHATAFGRIAVVVAAVVAALGLYTVTVKAVQVATAAWAAIQAVLDGELVANPIGLVVVAIAALVGGVIYAYKHFETFRNIVNTAGHAAVVAFGAVVSAVTTAVNWIRSHWSQIYPFIIGPTGMAIKWVIEHWNQITSTASAVINKLKSIFLGAYHAIVDPIASAYNTASNLISSIGSAASGIGGKVSGLFGFAAGGIVGSMAPQIQTAATGGARNGLVQVGEHGPELVSLAPGSRVYSNGDSQRMLRDSGGSGRREPARVEFIGERGVLEFLRHMVRTHGNGDVQIAFGSN